MRNRVAKKTFAFFCHDNSEPSSQTPVSNTTATTNSSCFGVLRDLPDSGDIGVWYLQSGWCCIEPKTTLQHFCRAIWLGCSLAVSPVFRKVKSEKKEHPHWSHKVYRSKTVFQDGFCLPQHHFCCPFFISLSSFFLTCLHTSVRTTHTRTCRHERTAACSSRCHNPNQPEHSGKGGQGAAPHTPRLVIFRGFFIFMAVRGKKYLHWSWLRLRGIFVLLPMLPTGQPQILRSNQIEHHAGQTTAKKAV